jgi:hypothetical protein
MLLMFYTHHFCVSEEIRLLLPTPYSPDWDSQLNVAPYGADRGETALLISTNSGLRDPSERSERFSRAARRSIESLGPTGD